MLHVVIPENEPGRLAALQRYEILDTPADGSFDEITKMAAKLFSTPIAIISLVDTDRIWFKSHHGLDVEQIDRGYEAIDERLRALGARIERVAGITLSIRAR